MQGLVKTNPIESARPAGLAFAFWRNKANEGKCKNHEGSRFVGWVERLRETQRPHSERAQRCWVSQRNQACADCVNLSAPLDPTYSSLSSCLRERAPHDIADVGRQRLRGGDPLQGPL